MGKIIATSTKNAIVTIKHCDYCGRSLKCYEVDSSDELGFYSPICINDQCDCKPSLIAWQKEKAKLIARWEMDEEWNQARLDKIAEYTPSDY